MSDHLNEESRNLHILCRPCYQFFCVTQGNSEIRLDTVSEWHTLHNTFFELKEALVQQCHFCSLFWYTLKMRNGLENPEDIGWQNARISIKFLGDRLKSSHIEVRCEGITLEWPDISFWYKLTHGKDRRIHRGSEYHPAQSAIITSSIHHMNLMKYWLQECLTKHPNCRQEYHFAPTRLVHVGSQDGRVPIHLSIPGKQKPPKYCAFSHCWGGADDILTLRSGNIKEFQGRILFDSLPKSFQDAIILTRCLGVEYIWIDSLCIIQDSLDDWSCQAPAMKSVYTNSLCTIAALGAQNAHQGCYFNRDPLTYAWCRISGSENDGLHVRPWPQRPIEEEFTLGRPPGETPLLDRAWTFQERVLSPRLLYLGKRGIFWSCRAGTATEEDYQGHLLPLADKPGIIFGPTVPELRGTLESHDRNPWEVQLGLCPLELSSKSFSNEEELYNLHALWFQIIFQYTRGQLTKERDKLIAIYGIAQSFQECSGLEYICGVWRQTLYYDLVWFVYRNRQHQPSSHRAPTWSWASVDGEINSRSYVWWLDPMQGECSFYSFEQQPSVKILDARSPTDPTEMEGTGQISSGFLTLIGVLKQVKFSLHITTNSVMSFGAGEGKQYQLFNGQTMVGILHPDYQGHIDSDIYYLPIFEGNLSHRGKQAWCSVGLLLHCEGGHFRRNALYELRTANHNWIPPEWFEQQETRMITIY